MKSYTNMVDPERKKKVTMGKAKKSPITQETLKEDAQRAKNAPDAITGSQTRTFPGTPAPRVGGKAPAPAKQVSGSPTVKLMKKSVKRAKQSSASTQAKKAAIRALKRM